MPLLYVHQPCYLTFWYLRIWKDIFYKYFNLHFSYQWHWTLPFSNEKPFILPFLLHNILCSFFSLCCHFFLLICWPLHILRTLALYSMFCKCVPFVVWFLSWFMLCVCFCLFCYTELLFLYNQSYQFFFYGSRFCVILRKVFPTLK